MPSNPTRGTVFQPQQEAILVATCKAAAGPGPLRDPVPCSSPSFLFISFSLLIEITTLAIQGSPQTYETRDQRLPTGMIEMY